MKATAFPSGAPAGTSLSVIRRVGDEVEMVKLRWGLRSPHGDPNGSRFVRSEERTFPSHRCLIPATDFQVVRDEKPFRVSLEDGNWFYLAGVWRPAEGDWPESFAVVTAEANREVGRYQSRQGAFLRRNRHMAWLDHLAPEHETLATPPDGIFVVTPVGSGIQRQLAL